MTPTPRLRWVERSEVIGYSGSGAIAKTIRVLQQWYAYDIQYPATKGEWKDVPLEKEND